MLLGGNLLVAAVVEPGQRARRVYLPAGSGWYDFWSGDYYTGGQEILLPAPWDRPPLLARADSAIPLNVAEQHFAKPADQRGFICSQVVTIPSSSTSALRMTVKAKLTGTGNIGHGVYKYWVLVPIYR